MSSVNVQPRTQMLRIATVCEVTGLSRTQLYRLVKTGKFPSSVQLGANSVAWASDAVDAWVADKIAATRCPTPAFGVRARHMTAASERP
jgi:prophage regulatory protein